MDTVQVHVIECYLKCPTFTVSNGCPVTTPTEPVRGNIHKSTHHPFVNIQKSTYHSFINIFINQNIINSFISQHISHLWTFISQLIYLIFFPQKVNLISFSKHQFIIKVNLFIQKKSKEPTFLTVSLRHNDHTTVRLWHTFHLI